MLLTESPLGWQQTMSPSSSLSIVRHHLDNDNGLGRILVEARDLRTDVNQLRQVHLAHIATTNELLHDTFIKLMVSARFIVEF